MRFITVFGGLLLFAVTFPKGTSADICSADVKKCPDGSFITRKGPHCEFPACNGESDAKTTSSSVGKIISDLGTIKSSIQKQASSHMRQFMDKAQPAQREKLESDKKFGRRNLHGTICPADVRECQDGTWVSRVPPKCEFTPCPDGNPPKAPIIKDL